MEEKDKNTIEMVLSKSGAVSNNSIRQRTLLEKIVETGVMIAAWLALGIYLEIFGPTLIDLKIKLNTDYEKVAVAVSGRAYGLFPGCVIGGVMVDKLGLYCHLIIALSLDIAGVVTVAIPWSPNEDIVWFLCFVGGLVESIIAVAGQRIILNIWQEKSAGPLHLLHMGYGIGSFIIPLYTNPFLAVEQDTNSGIQSNSSLQNTTESYMADFDNHTVTTNTSSPVYEKESRIEFSYAISASYVTLLSLAFFVYQIRENRIAKRYKTKEPVSNTVSINEELVNNNEQNKSKTRSLKQMINPATCTGGDLFYGIQIFGLLAFYYANVNGGERVIGGFLRTYAVDQLDFSKDNASYINTAFWVSFTLGRFCFFILAKFVSIRIVLMIETIAITVISILLNIFATNNQLAYWLLLQPLGFFLAPLWPSGIGWSDYHIELTGVAMALTMLGGSLGGICYMRIIGYIYEHVGPKAFLYQVQVYAVLVLMTSASLNFIGYRHGSRFDLQSEKEKSQDN